MIEISSNGLSNIVNDAGSCRFKFIVGSHIFHCNRYLADFISPAVSHLHSVDFSIDSFKIDGDFEESDFSFVLSLIQNGSCPLEKYNLSKMFSISKQLGNTELMNQINSILHKYIEITTTNIIEELNFAESNGLDMKKLIKFAASNFSSICGSITDNLSLNVLEQILSSSSLTLTDEGSLLSFICQQIYSRGDDFRPLLSYVELSQLEKDELKDFLKLFQTEDIDAMIWHNVCHCLLSKPSHAISERYAPTYKLFRSDEDNLFDGIINHLNNECNGNAAHSIIKVSTTGTFSGSLMNLFEYDDFTNSSSWTMENNRNGYFEIDFCQFKVQITDYSMATVTNNFLDDNIFPKSWEIMGSNDRLNWESLDLRKNDHTLHGHHRKQIFRCKNISNESYKFIRLYQRGGNHYSDDDYRIYITAFELYGTLEAPKLKNINIF